MSWGVEAGGFRGWRVSHRRVPAVQKVSVSLSISWHPTHGETAGLAELTQQEDLGH